MSNFLRFPDQPSNQPNVADLVAVRNLVGVAPDASPDMIEAQPTGSGGAKYV